METQEIEKIKSQVDEDQKDKTQVIDEEEAIAQMAESAGWAIMMKKYRKKMLALLEPIQHQDIAEVKDLVLIGSMAIARREKIDILTEFVNEAESVKKAKRELREKQKKEEESKKEA